jgi:hypothetical protein
MKKLLAPFVLLVCSIAALYLVSLFTDASLLEKTTPIVIEEINSFSDPLNGTYEIDGGKIALKNGVAANARIFGVPTTGDISEDGLFDSVFFITVDNGGSGTFFYVVAALQKDGAYVPTNAIFLGDRISPQNITISKGQAVVNYVVRRDLDPMTASPSVGVTKYLIIKDGELVQYNRIEEDAK